MPAYPTTPKWRYPVTLRLAFDTAVSAGKNGVEQRWARTAGTLRLSLTYSALSLAEMEGLLTLFDSQKGRATAGLSLVVAAGLVEPANLAFESDELEFEERASGQWSGVVNLAQHPWTASGATPIAAFPTLASGALVQLPASRSHGWTSVVLTTQGGRSAYSPRAASVSRWRVGGSSLSDADARALWAYFSSARGRWASFSFVEPDGGTTKTCRFLQDELVWTMLGPEQNELTTTVTTTPGVIAE